MSATAKRIAVILLLLATPLGAFASPVSVDRLDGNHIEPLVKTDFIRSVFFTATSSTATSTLPILDVPLRFLGAGLTDCVATNSFIVWNSATWQFGCASLDASGNWTGTFDGQEGTWYVDRANHTGTQLSTTISDFVEAAQDAVGNIFSDTNTIDLTYTDGGPSISADARTQMSITSDASGLKLSGDATTPGNTKYYGTDGGGSKGFFDFPAGAAALTNIGPTGQTVDGPVVTIASSTTGTDFTITGGSDTLTFNLPVASAVNTGKLSATDWSTFNGKENVLSFVYPLVRSVNSISLAFGTTTQNFWSAYNHFTYGIFATNASSTNATTTGAFNFSSFTSALLQTDAEGDVSEYGGTSCTNQFIRALSALGIATCESVVLGTDTTGNYVATIAGTTNQITASASTGNVTLSLPAHVIFPSSYQAALGTTTNATSTTSHYFPFLLSKLLRTDSAGKLSEVTLGSGVSFDGTTLTATGLGGTVSAIGPTAQTADGPTVTLATSTSAFNGLTPNLVITGSGDTLTFTSSLAGTLGIGGGGTGTTTMRNGGFLWSDGTVVRQASTTGLADYDPTLQRATFKNATTTALTVSGNLYVGSLTGVLTANSGAVSTGVDGTDFTLINANTCTNQVFTAVTAAGVFTCASINNAHWSGTDLSVANGGTGLSTFGGTNHILYTTAADTLASEAAFLYDSSADRLTVVNASTTRMTATYASSTNAFFGTLSVGTLNGLLEGTAGSVGVATAGTDYIAGGVGNANQFAYFTGSGVLASDAGFTLDATADRATFTYASTTAFSTSYASSTQWFGGGLVTDCDNAVTSKLLWDNSTGQFSCGTDQTGAGANYFTNSTDFTYLSTGKNLGVGTTSPYARLSIHGGSTDTYNNTLFAVASSTAVATSTHFSVLANGNVGVGTSTPFARLSVVATSTQQAFVVNGVTGLELDSTIIDNTGWLGVGTYTPDDMVEIVADPTTGAGSQAAVQLSQYGYAEALIEPALSAKVAYGTEASPTGMQNLDFLFSLNVSAYHSGGAFANAGGLRWDTTETWTNTNRGTILHFQVVPTAGTSKTTIMSLTGGGLVIDGDGTQPTASGGSSLRIGDNSDAGTFEMEDGPACIGDGGCTPFTTDGTLLVEGRVGIGTTTPSAQPNEMLAIQTTDNQTAVQIHFPVTSANCTASDTYINFTTTAGSIGSIACTATSGLIGYNTFTGSHYTIIDDKTGLEVFMVLESTGEIADFTNRMVTVTEEYRENELTPAEKNEIEVLEKKLNDKANTNPRLLEKENIVDKGIKAIGKLFGASTKTDEERLEELHAKEDVVKTRTVTRKTNAAPKDYLSKARISQTRGSKMVYGVYGGTDPEGRDFVFSLGTGKIWVANKGKNIEVGDFLMSSNVRGMAELQGDGTCQNITVAKARQPIVWQPGETKRLIGVTYKCE